MRPFFSIVIPCYNDGRYAPGVYLDRLLSCLTNQGIKKEDIEVIISDDHSPLPYEGTLNRYKDKLTIKYVQTYYNFAPGNTRERGLKEATGQWLCFIDHDDMLYPNALARVKDVIEVNKENLLVVSDFNKVDMNDNRIIVQEFTKDNLDTWLHGKFYNLDNLWKKYDIHFPKDLRTHEDIAIGTVISCIIHTLGDYQCTYLACPTYMWTFNPESISHSSYVPEKLDDGCNHEFLELTFEDYIRSKLGMYIDSFDKTIISKSDAVNAAVSQILELWMLTSRFKVTNPETYLKVNDAYCAQIWDVMKDKFGITPGAVKVIMATNFAELKTKLDNTAKLHNIPNVSEWIDELNKLDYHSIIAEAASEKAKEELASNTTLDFSKRPFFSIIIACYNDGRYKKGVYLDRLLDSLCRQGVDGSDIEVVLSDDCSPISFDDIVAPYQSRLRIKRIKTDYNFAPGNTREKGLTIATGEWIAFADHDDMYYNNALKQVKDAIIAKDEKHFLFGDFYGVNTDGEVTRKYEKHMNWCHGKFYNRDNLWDKYGIHFIHDLKSHEDIAICTQVSCTLASYIPNYTYLHIPVYAWTDNPQSVSHSKYSLEDEKGEREFLEVFFSDYIQSTGYVYLEQFSKHTIKMEFAVKCCFEIMCYCYFYTQGFQFRRPDDFYAANLDYAGQFINECKKAFNINNHVIYRVVSSEGASMYYRVRNLADPGSGRYIPTQTFKQWLELVSPEEP